MQYVSDVEDIYKSCLTNSELHYFLGQRFIAGLNDPTEIGLTQIYLNGARAVKFPEAKEAVIKAFSPIGKPGPFDNYYEQDYQKSKAVTQAEVNSQPFEPS